MGAKKFLTGIWPMSQNQPEAAFFYPSQDRLAIDKLSAFGTELGIVTKTRRGATKTTQEIVKKTRLKSSYLLSGISPNTWWTCLGTTVGEQYRPQLFDPVAQ
jgi:hypothetical protein